MFDVVNMRHLENDFSTLFMIWLEWNESLRENLTRVVLLEHFLTLS